jgi:pilus assembly protein Flp/PilA
MGLLQYKAMVLLQHVRELRDREEGQALVEYALIIALVSVVALTVLTDLGTNIVDRLQEAVDALA